MTRDEAQALFDEVVAAYAAHQKAIKVQLVYAHAGSASATWYVAIVEWNGVMQWHLAKKGDWQRHQQSFPLS